MPLIDVCLICSTSSLPKALLPLHAVWNHAAARDIKHIIKTQNIDAVHIHNTLLLLSPAVVRAAKSTGVPVVQTLHNFRLFCQGAYRFLTVRTAPATACPAPSATAATAAAWPKRW